MAQSGSTSDLGVLPATMRSVEKSTDGSNEPGKFQPKVILPPFPGQDALLHDANKWREIRDDRLTSVGLLDVAKGGTPSGINDLVDYDR